jgi:esterase/lipase
MGAATILMAYPIIQKDNLLAVILDSPFSSVKRVYRNAVKKVISLPDVVIDLIYNYAKSKILERYKFDLEEVKPLENARKLTKPTGIIGTKEDQIVDFEDLQFMFENVSCFKKKLFDCEGSHIDDRPDHVLVELIEFLDQIYEKKKELASLVYVQRSNS